LFRLLDDGATAAEGDNEGVNETSSAASDSVLFFNVASESVMANAIERREHVVQSPTEATVTATSGNGA